MMTITGVDEQTAVSMNFTESRMAQAVSAINTPLTNVSRIYGPEVISKCQNTGKQKKLD